VKINYPPEGNSGMVLVVFTGEPDRAARYVSIRSEGPIDWHMAERYVPEMLLRVHMDLDPGFLKPIPEITHEQT
jgi:hypothetical protein